MKLGSTHSHWLKLFLLLAQFNHALWSSIEYQSMLLWSLLMTSTPCGIQASICCLFLGNKPIAIKPKQNQESPTFQQKTIYLLEFNLQCQLRQEKYVLQCCFQMPHSTTYYLWQTCNLLSSRLSVYGAVTIYLPTFYIVDTRSTIF